MNKPISSRKARRQAIRDIKNSDGISRKEAKSIVDLSIASQNAYDRYNQANVTTHMMKPSEASEINQEFDNKGQDGAMYHPVGDTFQDPTELQPATVQADRPASQEQLDFNRNIRQGTDSVAPYIAGSLAGSYTLANLLGWMGATGAVKGLETAGNISSKYGTMFNAPLKKRKIGKALGWLYKKGKRFENLDFLSPGKHIVTALNKAGYGGPLSYGEILPEAIDWTASAIGTSAGFVKDYCNDNLSFTNSLIDTGLTTLPLIGNWAKNVKIRNYIKSLHGDLPKNRPELEKNIKLGRDRYRKQYNDDIFYADDVNLDTPINAFPKDKIPNARAWNLDGQINYPVSFGGTLEQAKGTLNHEFQHSVQKGDLVPLSIWPGEGYYIPNPNSNIYNHASALLNTKYKNNNWVKSPAEVDAELANLRYIMGFDKFSSLDGRKQKRVTKLLANEFGIDYNDMYKLLVDLEKYY